jgi:thioredoxin reductase (NADPH)
MLYGPSVPSQFVTVTVPFVLTGVDSTEGSSRRAVLPLETSQPGVFAVGDVRAGSTKRVAAAVGEGAAVVAQIHSVLAAG